MKKLLLLLGCTAFLGSGNLTAQSKLTGHLNLGYIVPFTDLTETNYSGYDPNMAASLGLGYVVYDNLRLRGDFMIGMLNGDNGTEFYQTTIFEPKLALEYNVATLFSEVEKYRINVVGGAGVTLSQARAFDFNTRALLRESPTPQDRFMSPNVFLSGGFNFGYAVAENLEINLGYEHRALLGQEYLDATQSGDFSDQYGMINLGLVFGLGAKKKPGMIEMEKRKYNKMQARMDSLESAAAEGNQVKVARLEMKNKEQETEIERLRTEMDSMRIAQVSTTVPTDNSNPEKPTFTGDKATILGTPSYRLIVASLPSQAQAQRWIDRSNLDASEMVVAYVEDLNTYRVVYKSFENLAAAKKEKQTIKGTIPDAWIVKF